MFKNFVYDIGTKVYFGPVTATALGQEVKAHGHKLFFIYQGDVIKNLGIYDLVMNTGREAGFDIVEFSKIQPNPRHTDIQEGIDLCRKEQCDVILVAGGGSAIDSAKAIATGVLIDAPIWDVVLDKYPVETSLPLLTISTVSATGSEMNMGAIISNLKTKDKLGLRKPSQRPKATFLNPEYTFTVPKFQTACGSVDILCHTLETYFSSDNCMTLLDTFMEGLVRTVIEYAPIAYEQPDNYEARANLMWAAPWAINDFLRYDKENNWTMHPIEHEVSAFYDITHGLGLAIIMPRYLRHIIDEKSLKRFRNLGINAFGLSSELDDITLANKTIEAIEAFCFEKLHLESNFTALGIDSSEFEIMAGKLAVNNGYFTSGYRKLSKQDIIGILNACL